jgi:hypothetical protein
LERPPSKKNITERIVFWSKPDHTVKDVIEKASNGAFILATRDPDLGDEAFDKEDFTFLLVIFCV